MNKAGVGMTKEEIYQAFVRHWETVGKFRNGWIADPNQIGPIVRRRNANNHQSQNMSKLPVQPVQQTQQRFLRRR
jgi:hypothetical protein